MEADFSLGAEVGGSSALRDQLAAVLTAFEHATGLQVCVKTMSERWRDTAGADVVPKSFKGHRSRFCETVKAKAFSACAKSDRTDLPGLCSPPDGPVVKPFVRTCHAGADEVLLPLWSDGVLVAVLFIGQFTRQDSNAAGRHGDLRHISDTDTRRLQNLTLPLRSYLMEILRKLDDQRIGHKAGRHGTIDAYIRETLSTGPTLPELASRLSLSLTRASHVVRELTGRSFQDLVDERRIAVAQDLLVNSEGTVAWVAHQTGFKDVAYFCRYFKRKTSTTPTTYRNRHRQLAIV